MKNLLLPVFLLVAGGAAALDFNGFKNPSVANRPETWFHVIGGNLSRAGLAADLDAIHAAGLSGIQFFHGQFGGPWPGVEKQIPCLSPEWDETVGFTADTCARLGLTFKMQNCPGWSMSGGPWIAPSNAMRHLVFDRRDVVSDAKEPLRLTFPARTDPDKDFRPVAVLAFPTPVGDTGTRLVPVRVSNPDFSGPLTADKNQHFKPCASGSFYTTELTFSSPVVLRTLELPSPSDLNHAYCYTPDLRVRFEAVLPNGTTRTVAEETIPQGCWQDHVAHSLACDEVESARWRLTLTNAHDMDLKFVRFWSGARLDNWEGRAAWTLRGLQEKPVPRQSSATWLRAADIRDVSDRLDAEGAFVWNAPAGRWTVLRLGHENTLRRNGPAPKEGTGWECDKLDTRGFDANFAGYIGRLLKGPLAGGKLKGLLVDSWECGRQTWTPRMEVFFRQANGYEVRRWLPAVFGWVIDSPDATGKFLLDWRRTIGGLVEEHYYRRMAELGHANGLHVQYETAFGDVFPGDLMRFWRYADTPMCEFWQPHDDSCFVGSFNFKPIRPCVSAARIYGKKRVAAEAFTSFALTWNEDFRLLKSVADKHFARGVTHLVFHTYTHNPLTNGKRPGSSFGSGIGTPFLREQTWWPFLPELTRYFARCGALLEAGLPVSDVLRYLGDAIGHKPDENAAFPEGFKYDYCNPDALFTRLDVVNGRFVTPDGGPSWRVLWIPTGTFLLPETEKRLAALTKKGGRIVRGTASQAVEGLDPDLLVRKTGTPQWLHRADGTADWYFLANAASTGVVFTVDCRASGEALVWDPVKGTRFPAEVVSSVGRRTTIRLPLAPYGSAFLVFQRNRPIAAQKESAPVPVRSFPLSSPWHLSFSPGPGAPGPLSLATLAAWKDLPGTAEAKAFSGTAAYETTFTVPEGVSVRACELDLGRVEAWARVFVNGTFAGALWCEPYRCDISALLKPGINTLKIDVTSTWFNRLVYDASLPMNERKTWTISGPKAGTALVDAGLLGPVTVNGKVSK